MIEDTATEVTTGTGTVPHHLGTVHEREAVAETTMIEGM